MVKSTTEKKASGFTVHLATPTRVAELNPAAYNPRRISPEKFEALKESIRIGGFMEALVIQKNGMRVIAGHQRLRAVKEISVEDSKQAPDLPCIVLDLSDTEAKKLNIRLNKIRGEFEERLLGELLVDIYESDKSSLSTDAFGMLGFDNSVHEAEGYIRLIEPNLVPMPDAGSGSEPSAFGRSITLSVEFDSVALRDKVKKLLSENSKTTKQKTGSLVAQALGFTKKAVRPKKSVL